MSNSAPRRARAGSRPPSCTASGCCAGSNANSLRSAAGERAASRNTTCDGIGGGVVRVRVSFQTPATESSARLWQWCGTRPAPQPFVYRFVPEFMADVNATKLAWGSDAVAGPIYTGRRATVAHVHAGLRTPPGGSGTVGMYTRNCCADTRGRPAAARGAVQLNACGAPMEPPGVASRKGLGPGRHIHRVHLGVQQRPVRQLPHLRRRQRAGLNRLQRQGEGSPYCSIGSRPGGAREPCQPVPRPCAPCARARARSMRCTARRLDRNSSILSL